MYVATCAKVPLASALVSLNSSFTLSKKSHPENRVAVNFTIQTVLLPHKLIFRLYFKIINTLIQRKEGNVK